MAAPSQLVGQILGHYRIIEQIGAGGMGVVYRAHDEQLERDVAIKVLPVGTLADEAARKRFRKEALALAKLNHPNIATIFEFSSQNSTDYLVTEYISGLTLDHKLASGSLSEKEVVSLGIQLAQGLSAAHEHGIVHRDLKPANLRLTSDGRLKILDFGLAQLMPRASEMGMTATLTQSQEVTGTLPYMAPEQLRGEPAEARTDIWAAGAVLYEMATAHRPFEQKVPSALTDDIFHKPPPPPRRLRSELSPKLEAVILRCLEKEPAKRYQSARELQSDLEAVSTGLTPIAARRRLWPIILTSAIVLVVFAVGAFFYTHRATALTEKDTLVLADFDNKTGDAVFDDSLKQALAADLEQSPFLNILSDRKVTETLQLMGRRPGAKLTPDLARDLCQRTASKVVLGGSITSLGNQYLIGLNAVNCITGDTLAREQVQAAGKEHVVKTLDKAASDLRRKLGESLSSIQKFDMPIEQATTASLEALKAYSLAMKALVEGDFAASVPLFQRAIGLDPGFASAYAWLGVSYFNLGETSGAVENTRKAYQLRDQVSEREKFLIESNYYSFVTADLEKARQSFELWGLTYPRDVVPSIGLSYIHENFGEFDKAVAADREALRLDPGKAVCYSNLVGDYMNSNRLGEARATIDEAQAKKLDSPSLHTVLYQLAFLQGDAAGMAQQVAWSAGKPGVEDVLLANEASTAAYTGQLGKAREFSRRAVVSSERAEEKETAAGYEADAALREALFGDPAEAKRRTAAALGLSTGPDVQYRAALALAVVGDTVKAHALMDELAKRFPEGTIVQFKYLPAVRAQLALSRNNAAKAIEAVQAATPFELGSSVVPLFPVYVRGEAYLAAHQGSEAAAEFQKIVDHRGTAVSEPISALAHLGLARAYAISGDTNKSRTAYQDFFALWKDADPDIPGLKQAKAEYAKLQ